MTFDREFHLHVPANGWAEFRAQPGNAVSESMMESELLAIIRMADPCLDDVTGRLLPGSRAASIAVRLLALGHDTDGHAQLAGITCSTALAASVARLAAEHGYRVVGSM